MTGQRQSQAQDQNRSTLMTKKQAQTVLGTHLELWVAELVASVSS